MRGKIVAWLWPVDCTFIVNIRLSPPGNETCVPSTGEPPACSSTKQMPRPRNRPFFFDSRLRALKPSTSASARPLSTSVAKSPLS